jgi:hypothetical protein
MSTVVGERRRIYPGIDQALLRGAVVVGAMTSIVAAQAAGARPKLWEDALLTVLTLILALRPESSTGVVLLVGLAYVWSTVSDPLSPLVLVAAAGMVLLHVAALTAAQGPAAMRIEGAQVRRQARRATLLWLAAATVWALDLVADGLPDGRLVYATGLTLLLAIAAVATWMVSSRR